MKTWIALSLLVICGALPVACEATTTEDVGAGGDPVVPSGGAASPCRDCLRIACDNEWTRCLSEPECASHLTCVDECDVDARGGPDPACEFRCPTPSDGVGQDALAAVAACRSEGEGRQCESCGVSQVDLPDVLQQTCRPSVSSDDLGKCLEENCCESRDRCFAIGTPCDDVIACEDACADAPDVAACELDCWRNDPEGAAEWAEYLTCAGYHCVEELGGGEPPCLECERTECPHTWAACQVDVPCVLLTACLAGCLEAGPSCVDGCFEAAPPATLAIFEALDLCKTARCIGACEVEP